MNIVIFQHIDFGTEIIDQTKYDENIIGRLKLKREI